MFILKKLHVLPKLMLLKFDQYQLNIKSIIMIVTSSNIHYFKTLKGNSCSYVQKKTGIML